MDGVGFVTVFAKLQNFNCIAGCVVLGWVPTTNDGNILSHVN